MGDVSITTVTTIKRWFDRGISESKEYMIVATDTFSYEDYPVYCSESEVRDKVDKLVHREFTRVQEVYDLSKPFREEGRVFDLPRCFS